MTDLGEDPFTAVKQEHNPDSKLESDAGKDAQEVKSHMDDGCPIIRTVHDATGYSGSEEED